MWRKAGLTSTLESLSIFSSFATKKEGFVALFFLWRRERDSRLRRTRPGKQRVSAVWFAYRACGCLNLCANCSLPLASPPSNPSQYSVRSPQKKEGFVALFLWRRERDSNPRIVAHQRFSSFIPRLLSFVCYCCLAARIVGKSAF